MADEGLTYETWIDEALRGVVRRALDHACSHGLPGDHHFYITFRTDGDGVEVPTRLREQHPEQMTIVLQHQFWDLAVEDWGFSVTLKFRGRSERLRIPFAAVTAFADPAVSFGLQFKLVPVPEGDEAPAPAGAGEEPAASAAGDAGDKPGGDDAATKEPGSGQVIVLDSFRKT